jgi:hypothetical protein
LPREPIPGTRRPLPGSVKEGRTEEETTKGAKQDERQNPLSVYFAFFVVDFPALLGGFPASSRIGKGRTDGGGNHERGETERKAESPFVYFAFFVVVSSLLDRSPKGRWHAEWTDALLRACSAI